MARSRARKTDRAEGWSLLRGAIVVVIFAWAFRSFVFAPFTIPSGSMLPAVYIGDYVAVAKWPYGFSRYSFPFDFPSFRGRILPNLPKRGDVVVLRPAGEQGEDFIKRVIGLPGDTIAVRGGVVLLNGKPLRREPIQPVAIPVSENSPCRKITAQGIAVAPGRDGQCLYRTYRETLPDGTAYRVIDQLDNPLADNLAPTRVPDGQLFLMGDNRDDSLDSRFAPAEGGIGFVPVENLVGRATTIFWSTDGSADYLKPWTWFTALRWGRLGSGFGGGE